jgi:GABA(A) receptor-associated protein
MLPFRQRLTEDQRRHEFSRVSDKLHRFVPIIMERGSVNAPHIEKEKYLVPVDLTMAQLSFVVRKRLHMRASDALFLMVNKTLCTSSATSGSMYDAHRDTDGFLYVTYTMENTFG